MTNRPDGRAGVGGLHHYGVVGRADRRFPGQRLPGERPEAVAAERGGVGPEEAELVEAEAQGPRQVFAVGVQPDGLAGVAGAGQDQLGRRPHAGRAGAPGDAAACGSSPPGRRSIAARKAASAGSIVSRVEAEPASGTACSTRGKRASAWIATWRVQAPARSATWVPVGPRRTGTSRGRALHAKSGTARTRRSSSRVRPKPPYTSTCRPSVAIASEVEPLSRMQSRAWRADRSPADAAVSARTSRSPGDPRRGRRASPGRPKARRRGRRTRGTAGRPGRPSARSRGGGGGHQEHRGVVAALEVGQRLKQDHDGPLGPGDVFQEALDGQVVEVQPDAQPASRVGVDDERGGRAVAGEAQGAAAEDGPQAAGLAAGQDDHGGRLHTWQVIIDVNRCGVASAGRASKFARRTARYAAWTGRWGRLPGPGPAA